MIAALTMPKPTIDDYAAALAEVTRERDALRAEVAPAWARAMVTAEP